MAATEAIQWIERHWSPESLPNNMWIVANGNRMLAADESVDPLIDLVRRNFSFEQVAFAWVTFDLWQ